MTTNREPIRRLPRDRLSHSQQMVLLYGWDRRWADAFLDEGELRDAWERTRDRLLSSYRNGHRPVSWWKFDAPPDLKYPGYDHERSLLWRAGLLEETERAELEAFWREQFERAQAPDFSLCNGPNDFSEGAAAKRGLYAWADIPAELRREWTEQRKRRARMIKKLRAAGPQPA